MYVLLCFILRLCVLRQGYSGKYNKSLHLRQRSISISISILSDPVSFHLSHEEEAEEEQSRAAVLAFLPSFHAAPEKQSAHAVSKAQAASFLLSHGSHQEIASSPKLTPPYYILTNSFCQVFFILLQSAHTAMQMRQLLLYSRGI